MVEEIGGGALFDDRALGHEDDAVGDLAREAHLMRDDDHRHAVFRKVAHQIEHLADHLGVERGGRLVEEHDLGRHGERAHDGDTLLLAAGEHRGILVCLVGKADALKQRHGLLVGLRLGLEAQLDGREGDVLLDCHMREEVEVLEHHAHLAAVEVQVDLLAVEGDILEVNGAGGRLLQEVQAAQQRRFAAAGGADDGHDLALFHA